MDQSSTNKGMNCLLGQGRTEGRTKLKKTAGNGNTYSADKYSDTCYDRVNT